MNKLLIILMLLIANSAYNKDSYIPKELKDYR